MRISSRSHLRYSGSYNTKETSGFSLVELLIVLAITAIIATIVVVRFSAFDSAVLLKSLSYEIGVSLREAQVYSLSVLGRNELFETPYGISFSPNAKEYTFFQYIGAQGTRPRFNEETTILNTFTIGRSLEVAELCVTRGGNTECDDIERLDVSFRRPEFEAIFYAAGENWNEGNNDEITSAEIKVRSLSAPEELWTVEVTLLGQITVRKES